MINALPSSVPAPDEIIGAYRVIREVGRGGMAAILEVEHTRTGERRAIKMMLPGAKGDEIASRMKSEFRALSRLSHPNVLRVFEAGVHGDRPYFIMELLEGRALRDLVETWRELPPTERARQAEQILIQIARALEYIHARGIVHRDVTPSNIFVGPDGTARLMDFGVVKEPGGELTMVGEVVGTVAYMAPEQITGGRVDARADLYSLGAVLYLMLTGRRPFNARTLAGYLEKHLHRPVRPPGELVPTLPRRLDEVCTRLLAKDPADRFASATHLLYVLEADGPTAAAPPGPPSDWRPSLAGRAAELGLVHEAVARLAAGQGGVLCIEGASGMGKSRLAFAAVEQCRRLGIPAVESSNTSPEQPAFAGFQPFYERWKQEQAAPPYPPVLEQAMGDARSVGAPLEWGAVVAAVKDLFSPDKPTLLVLDDIDQADRGTAELLLSLVRALLHLSRYPVLFVLTRSDGDPGAGSLGALLAGEVAGVPVQRLLLAPLSVSAVEAMVLSLIVDGPASRELARRLHRETDGNPYFIAEILRGLIEQGVIALGAEGSRGSLTLDVSTLQHAALPVPGTLKEAILERLRALPPDAGRLAATLAVSRQELRFDALIDAAGMDEEPALEALDALLAAGLVRERRAGGVERLELAHSRVKDVLFEQTPPPERVRLHRRLGEALERLHRGQVSAIVEQLAHHFERGEAPAKAYPYLVQSAEKLLSRGFVAEALQNLDRALVAEHAARMYLTLEEADRKLSQMLLLRATSTFHLGRWSEAWEEASRADELARNLQDPSLTSRTAAQLGVQARRRHDLDEAEVSLRRALEEGRRSGQRALMTQPLYEIGALLWTRGDLDGARSYWVEALASSEANADERSLALGYNGLGLLALCKGQVSEARDYLERSAALCEKHGLVERLVICNINLVELSHLTGHFRRGIGLADRTVSQAREMDHLYGIGLGLFYRALVLTDLGRWAEAEDNASEGLRIARGLNSHEDELSIMLLLARISLERHALPDAIQQLEQAESLLALYDAEGYAPMVHAWRACALAAAGRQEEARAAIDAALTSPGRAWPHQRARLALSLSRAWRLLGQRAEAQAQASAALALAEQCGFRNYVLLARLFLMRASPPEEATAHERVARSLAVSLAAGLDREDAQRFVAGLGLGERPDPTPADAAGQRNDPSPA